MDDYKFSVFINCPYDDDYKGLLDAIIFAITILGFTPKLALCESDSSVNRIDKIVSLIKTSKYSIHDLSRLKSQAIGEYSRLNMPFELGIDYGVKCILPEFSDKKFLILENERYSIQRALSDLSGVDVGSHNNIGIKLIECIRNWFVDNVEISNVPAPEKISSDYTLDFQPFLLEKAIELGFNEGTYVKGLTTNEFIAYVKQWKNENQIYQNIALN